VKPIGLTIPPNLLARADKVIRWACGDTTIEIDFSVDSIVSDITLMRRTVQRVFPWRWQVPTATAADFGVQILPDVQPVQLQNESWLLIWEVVTVTVIVFGAPACSCCEVGFPARRERCVGVVVKRYAAGCVSRQLG
jgi:hypothetical protein